MPVRVLLAACLAATAALGARPLGADEAPPVQVRSTPTERAGEASAGPPSVPGSPTTRADAAGGAVWSWPLDPLPRVVRRFEAPPGPYAAGHRGIDLLTSQGAEVLAVAAGAVTHAGVVAGRGTVTVAHPGGLSSTYEPVERRVEQGQSVAAGDVLGVVQPTGPGGGHCGTLTCLHLGARREGAYLDPYPLLRGGRAVLLPLSGLFPRPLP